MCGLGALTMAIGSHGLQEANPLISRRVLLGSVAFELMGIEKALKRLGDWIEARLTRPDSFHLQHGLRGGQPAVLYRAHGRGGLHRRRSAWRYRPP